MQRFIVPENATRLALGFADGFSVQGLPGHYSDNYGSVTVELDLKSVPEPSAILGLLTTVGLGIAIKRKQMAKMTCEFEKRSPSRHRTSPNKLVI